jgi:hypothetical protein
MNPANHERLLKEICQNGHLENYTESLDQLLKYISEAGVKVSTRYDVGYSNFEDYTDHIPRIRVSLTNVVHPLDIVWELMHEYGHYLSGKRKPEDITLEREILAWTHADRILHLFPEFAKHIRDYNLCKFRCLQSYEASSNR